MESSRAQVVVFAGAGQPAPRLEGLLSVPDGGRPVASLAAAVLCHPQPATSDMHDPLLAELAEQLAQTGIVALRFNFRGVGNSEGEQTDGRLEPLDVAGGVEYLLTLPFVRPDKLCAVGHAFGAYVALEYAAYDARIRTVVAVSPPTARLTPGLGSFGRPKLIVTGEYDEVSPRYKLEPWLAALPERALLVVSGAGHLMAGHEAVAAQAIVRYLDRWSRMPDA
jgi:uncharacterized protein